MTLIDVAKNGWPDTARVSAANALLDRGYGKPAVKEEIETIDLAPVAIQTGAPDEDAIGWPDREARWVGPERRFQGRFVR